MIIVVIDEPAGAYHGGDVAAPVFREIAEQILPDLGIAPDTEIKVGTGSGGPGSIGSAERRGCESSGRSSAKWRTRARRHCRALPVVTERAEKLFMPWPAARES